MQHARLERADRHHAGRLRQGMLLAVGVQRLSAVFASAARVHPAISERHGIASYLESYGCAVKLVIGITMRLLEVGDPRSGQWVHGGPLSVNVNIRSHSSDVN